MHPSEIVTNKKSFFYYDVSNVKGKYNYSLKAAHYHNYYEIYYLASGSGTILVEDNSYSVAPSNIVFIPPNIMHRAIYSSHERKRINLLFTADYINPALTEEFSHLWEQKIFTVKETKYISEILDKISKETLLETNIAHELVRCYLTELLAYIHRLSVKYNDYDISTSKKTPVQLAIEYINHHYCDDINLNELAALTNYSPNYFSKLFTDTIGIGYKKYVLLIRLKEAEKRIIYSNDSIKEIAASCGFNDCNRLSTLFKEIYGLSPIQYRKQISRSIYTQDTKIHPEN